MIKFILNFFRIIFAIFLLIVFIVKMYFLINTKIHEIEYPSILGYSYLKIDNNYLSPDINDGDYILLKNDKNININDYVAFLENDEIVLNKVININEEELTVGKDYIVNISDVKSKLIYTNKSVSKTLRILTNPISILVMLLFIIFIPQITYRRYNQ